MQFFYYICPIKNETVQCDRLYGHCNSQKR